MSKCNLLRPLGTSSREYNGGTFFLFSQYADDLTRQNAQGDAYRVVPSKFAAFDIDYSAAGLNLTNEKVGEIFQNTFEHSCSVFRHEMAADPYNTEEFTPVHSADLFWQTMTGLGFEAGGDGNGMLKWVGESDVCGTTVIDGDAFSEIYCFIPGTASSRTYIADSIDIDQARNPLWPNGQTGNYIFGWSQSTYPSTTDGGQTVYSTGLNPTPNTLNIETVACPWCLLPVDKPCPNDWLQSHADQINESVDNIGWDPADPDESYFKTNTIAVFYDVVTKDENGEYRPIYKNIPMGMYFTGQTDTENPGDLQNSIKKWVSHEDIYSQGTAYGLRITTKFSSHPCVNTGDQDTNQIKVIWAGHSVSEAAAIIDSMRAVADSVLGSISQNSSFNTALINHLSEFRNKSTNIPYVRTVNGDDYWFVNGRNTGRRVNGVTATIDEIIAVLWPQIQEYINDNLPTADESAQRPYIEKISWNKYANDSGVSEIPNTEDFQDLPSNVTGMFKGCASLTKIPRLETSNTENMSQMFCGCSSVKTVSMPDTVSCKNFSETFKGCEDLETVVIDATSATNFSDAFTGCASLKNVYIYNLRGGTASAPTYIDLRETQVTLHSLRKIIESAQAAPISLSNQPDPQNGYITLAVPATLAQSFSLENACLLALNNKGLMITIQ